MATPTESSFQRQGTVLDPITGLPLGWRRREFFENELGETADSINELMKLVCDRTGEDLEQMTRQSMAIRNTKAGASEGPGTKGPSEKSSPKRSSSSSGKLDPETFLPAGWVRVEKKYKTGTKAGKTYLRFQKENGGSLNYCTITQVLKHHLEHTGEDLMPLYHELKEQKQSEDQGAAESAKMTPEQKRLQRERYISKFRAAHGALTGVKVAALPGWSGEAKPLPCGQSLATYYDPEGRPFKLLKDIEAHFGCLMEEGKQIPNF
ncbi:unnamed protein product [Symbiodinium sp. CCMP2592]|nr:unnamed protein product [Symbiodinium sp. CCMP2592]